MSLWRKDNNELDAHDLREIRLRAIRGEAIDPTTIERMVDELTTLRITVEFAANSAESAWADLKTARAELRYLRSKAAP